MSIVKKVLVGVVVVICSYLLLLIVLFGYDAAYLIIKYDVTFNEIDYNRNSIVSPLELMNFADFEEEPFYEDGVACADTDCPCTKVYLFSKGGKEEFRFVCSSER